MNENVFSVNSTEDSRVNVFKIDPPPSNAAFTLQPKTFTATSFGMCMCFAVKHSSSTDINATHLIAGYENGSLVLWDLSSSCVKHETQLFTEPVMALDYNSIVNKGVSVSTGCDVIFWTVTTSDQLEVTSKVEMTNAGAGCVGIRGDGRVVAIGCWDGRARLYSMKSAKLLALLDFHKGSVQSVAFSEENMLAVASKDGAITLWDLYR